MASKSQTAGRADMPAREILLDAAAELMVERHDIDISLGDIAQRAGLNAALVKYYFGNKSGMLLALVRRVIRMSLSQLKELVDLPLGAEEKIRLHIRGLVYTYDRHPYLNRLLHYMLSENNDEYASMLAEELVRPVAAAQKSILEQGVTQGVLLPVNSMHFYFHLNGACEAMFYSRSALQHGFGVDSITKEMKQDYIDYLCETMLSGILVEPHAKNAS